MALTLALMALGVDAKAIDPSAPIPVPGGNFVGSGPDRLLLGVGAFNVIPNEKKGELGHADTTAEAQIEYRIGRKLFSVGPLIGIVANTEGGVFGYGAIYTELQFGRWIFTPNFGLGGYAQNGSKDLGGVFQFQMAVDGAYELDDGSRIGLRFWHVSNAGLNRHNTGAESFLVTYSLPLHF